MQICDVWLLLLQLDTKQKKPQRTDYPSEFESPEWPTHELVS